MFAGLGCNMMMHDTVSLTLPGKLQLTPTKTYARNVCPANLPVSPEAAYSVRATLSWPRGPAWSAESRTGRPSSRREPCRTREGGREAREKEVEGGLEEDGERRGWSAG